MTGRRITYAEDETKSVAQLVRIRLPSIAIGLLLGLGLSFVTSRFEEVLSRNVQVAFFIPLVVYLADAIGTQTQSIYTRDLRSGKASFKQYLGKEIGLGLIFGATCSILSTPVTLVWFGSSQLTLAVGLALFFAVALAPLVALLVTEVLQLEHSDPAVGAGPIATVIQDTLSVVIFGFIATVILA